MENDIIIKQWASEVINGIRFCNTQYANFEFPRHFHNYYTILIIEEGINQGFTEGHTYKISPGTILVINPGEIHAGRSLSQNFLKFSSLAVEDFFLKAILQKNGFEVNGDLMFYNKPVNDPLLARKLKVLHKAVHAGHPKMQVETYLLDFFFGLLKAYNLNGHKFRTEPADAVYLDKAKQFIKENYHQSLTLSQMASCCYVSEYHLIRQFQRYFGLTPFEYLRNYRVEKARQLLQQGESITQAALSVGFYDHSHFLKNFKKLTGMLPSQYRKSLCF